MRTPPNPVIFLFIASLSLFALPTVTLGESYDLSQVKGRTAFEGSTAARELLGKNGFVVADPAFKQIFDAYIKSPRIEKPSENTPMGASLPSFITTDSAWHTYHVLLEEGVKKTEEIQAGKLLKFSRQLLTALTGQNVESGSGDLALFASVGLALQDESFRQTLAPEAKRLVDGLRSDSASVAVPIGFNLSPLLFRAQGFYTQSPELSAYFAARQWYASVIFRLSNTRETRSAVALARVVAGNPDLQSAWQQLSDPFDAFLAPAEDGTIREYAGAAKVILGANAAAGPVTDSQLTEIQKRLAAQLPLPQINDQLLSPEQYADRGKQTLGFRLLPPRHLPCEVCFQNTVAPKIPNRAYPSGLDFLAASAVLRSPAAVRATQAQFGKTVAELILKTDCGPMPDSLHGEAMRLLATLQNPLPPQAPACMRNEAWADLQLWTQLGAWAEQRHTWALHTKLAISVQGMISPPKGIVAPYPDFFSGLATLARRTAAAFGRAGLDPQFDAQTVASDLLALLNFNRGKSVMWGEKERGKFADKVEQFSQFQELYYKQHLAEVKKEGLPNVYQKLESNLDDLIHRCAEHEVTNEADRAELRSFFDSRQTVARLLNEFASMCDRLTELAKKSLAGEALTEADAKWIENYGVTLAGFHFYYGNSYEVPADDFPMVTRIFSNPLADSMLYAGLARPQALYVIVADGNTKQLYRGAVLTYREFVRPNNQILDDASWRELISRGQTPPTPPFTRSFYAETSVGDLIKRLSVLDQDEDRNYGDVDYTLWQIGSRATDKDIPVLFEVLKQYAGDKNNSDVAQKMAETIGRLDWGSRLKELIGMLASGNTLLEDAAARILMEQPAAWDQAVLNSDFNRQPTRTRRLYCVILGSLSQSTPATRNLLLQALHDYEAGVRWQAALVIGKTNARDPSITSALLATLNDTNGFVVAVAAHSLVQLGVTNAAPSLLAKLESRILSTNTSSEDLARQSEPITGGLRIDSDYGLLDPDDIATRYEMRIPERARRMALQRVPPPSLFSRLAHEYSLTDALIEALGDLKYAPAADDLLKLRGTDYDREAVAALIKIAPERLTAGLLATAKDKKIDSYLREQAMFTLSHTLATNCVRDLIPLLADTTPILYSHSPFGAEWRVCDRAAVTIAILLGWQHESEAMRFYANNDQRDALVTRAREWAKSPP